MTRPIRRLGHPALRPISRQATAGGSFGRDELDSMRRTEFGSNNRDEFEGPRTSLSRQMLELASNSFLVPIKTRTGKASMGDKLRGGAEKIAGKMVGNPGLQERGQERKMGEYQQNDF
ncbi:hypothetical protein FB451DRAFT_1558521 [Mycena latifolia]|nr:hypothetical protein FB451DRAFT_1558521 [Mycena latifolia]